MAVPSRKPLVLNEYDVYGFDIDHTLAKYKLDFLFEVSFICFKETVGL